MTTTDPSTVLIVAEAKAAATRLSQAWPWLAEARIPGTVVVVERARDLRDAEIDEAEHWRDQAAKFASTKAGIVPSGPMPSPARIGPVTARAAIVTDVRALAEALWRTIHGGELDLAVYDPTTRVLRTRCPLCLGDHLLPTPHDEPAAEPAMCFWCGGRGTVPTGTVCIVCRTAGPCPCDLADAVVTVGLLTVADLLPHLTEPDIAAETLRVLDRADRRARNVAGVGEDRRIIKAPCPACGRRGDFYAEVSSPDRKQWTIRCDWTSCVCHGPSCGCGRPVRWPGRRHLWPAAEWDGPTGLAHRLGVDLPDPRHTGRPTLAQRAPWRRSA